MKHSLLGQVLFCTLIASGTTALLGPAIGAVRDAGGDRAQADLSNVKQLATATVIYTADADDDFPLAYEPTPDGGYRFDSRFTARGDDYQQGRFGWAVAIYPYCKSAKMYAAVGAPRVAIEGKANPALPGVGHAYNGLLHGYSANEIGAPSQVPLFTESYGFVNLEGWAVANPVMACAANHPCHYVPAKIGCGGTEPGTTSRLISYGAPQYAETTFVGKPGARLQVFARTDTSAKVFHFEDAASTAPYPAADFFWSRLDGEGKAVSAWTDASGCHPLRFRPDYDPERDPGTARETAR